MRKLKGPTSGGSTFTVIDSDGVGHNDRFCTPGEPVRGGYGTTAVYFTITMELRYAPSSFTDPVRILLVE